MVSLSFYSFEKFKEKLFEINLPILISIVALTLVILVVMYIVNKKTGGIKWDVRKLTYGAVCVSLSYILSFVKFYSMPAGGSITAASMLPIMAYGFMAGPLWGTLAGLVYSLLQIIQGAYFLTPVQFAFDYILPFTLLGTLPGLFKFKSETLNIYLGCILAIVVRYICHFISGYFFYGEYAAEYGFASPFTYSVSYNSFVLVDGAICLVILAIPAIRKLFKRM